MGRDSNSDGEGAGLEIDWESLKGQLSAGTLQALQQHAQPNVPNAERGNGAVETTASISGPSDDSSNTRTNALPDSNTAYKLKEYWDERFETEAHYDWLANYSDIADHVREVVPKDAKVLVVGCGNSGLSADMYDDGYRDMLSTDFSITVVDKMRSRNEATRRGLRWAQMDMLALDLEDASVDAVIDKAAMDALMVDKGDPWNPSPTVVEQTHKMCSEISRVLVRGGVYIQLSFEQAHFRKKMLLGEHRRHHRGDSDDDEHRCQSSGESGPTCTKENFDCVAPKASVRVQHSGGSIDGGMTNDLDDDDICGESAGGVRGGANGLSGVSGEGLVYGWDVDVREIQRERGCFGHFMYIMRKR